MNVEAIVVSAVVAAMVTLGIEWAAKPALEARKARLLRAVAREERLADALAGMSHCLDELIRLLGRPWSVVGYRRAVEKGLHTLKGRQAAAAMAFDSVTSALDRGADNVLVVAFGMTENVVDSLPSAGTDWLETLGASERPTTDTPQAIGQVLPGLYQDLYEINGRVSTILTHLRSLEAAGIGRRRRLAARARDGIEFFNRKKEATPEVRDTAES